MAFLNTDSSGEDSLQLVVEEHGEDDGEYFPLIRRGHLFIVDGLRFGACCQQNETRETTKLASKHEYSQNQTTEKNPVQSFV